MLKSIVQSDQTIRFQEQPISTSKLHEDLGINRSILEIYPTWYLIDGVYYYFKEMHDLEKVINELLGEHLASFFDLGSAKYRLAVKENKNGSQAGLISESVFDKANLYKNLFDIAITDSPSYIESETVLTKVLDLASSEEEKKKVILEILRMSIMDFYSHQVDRVFSNIDFQVKPKLSLAKLYDFSETFDVKELGVNRKYKFINNGIWQQTQEYIYENSLLRIVFPSKEMEEMFAKFPEIYDYFVKILDLDLEGFLLQVEDEYNLNIPDSILDDYVSYDKIQKQFVRKIK